jgi:dCMP deaminase
MANLDRMYLRMANIVAEQSKAARAQVGAMIVKNDNIISFGYNGTPNGFDNTCEYLGNDMDVHTKPEVLHAESNAITKLAKHGGVGSAGATLYCTYSPCFDCAKLIVQAGIKRVVYEREYRVSEQVFEFLAHAGVDLEQLDPNGK